MSELENKKYDQSRSNKKRRGKRSPKRRDNVNDRSENQSSNTKDTRIDPSSRDNNPMWYFLDPKLAEQTSQLAFQQLGGVPALLNNTVINYPHVQVNYWNPSPGVQKVANYALGQPKDAAINLAGFRFFTKMAAYTGRTQTYGPQDISMMILAMGEIISCMEWMRRVFGVSHLSSEQTRVYPVQILGAMHVDPDDFFKNYAEYRIWYNKLVTLTNQLPIPKNIAYFDKCASKYEKIYLDSVSPLGTVIVDNVATTWTLNEIYNEQGTGLDTTSFTLNYETGAPVGLQAFWKYLEIVEIMIQAMLNSTTLNVVYTDILNLSSKMSVEFWKFDYLLDFYNVMPEYNPNYLLQIHNATVVAVPRIPENDLEHGFTQFNDVVSNANKNGVYYNPGVPTIGTGGNHMSQISNNYVMLDSLVPNPTWEDRLEMTRFTSMSQGNSFWTIEDVYYDVDLCLPDHYLVRIQWNNESSSSIMGIVGSRIPYTYTNLGALASIVAKVDWAPMFPLVNTANDTFTGNMLGDLNYYTKIEYDWLNRLNQFVGFGLYDIRI